MADTVVRINLRPLIRLAKIPERIFNQWAARYRGFAKERFSLFSRGGGDWPPLKPKTIARRRRGRGPGRRAAILWDTGTLVGALDPDVRRKGRYSRRLDRGIEVGYGGGDMHPAGITIARLAAIHQFPLRKSKVPARPIIVEPPQRVVDAMADDVAKWWKSRAFA